MTKEEASNLIIKEMHNIIDCIHPLFEPITDEEMIDETKDYGLFERTFLQKENGKRFKLQWKVFFGTPETVHTVFEPAEVLQ